VNYQQQFYEEPLLILNTINWGPPFDLKSLSKTLFPSHGATVGTPSLPPPPFQDSFDATASVPRPRPTRRPWGDPGTAIHQAAISFAVGEMPPRGLPSLSIVHPRLRHHKFHTSTPHLYILSGTTVDLWALLPPPSTSCRATPSWGALPGELPFPPTLHPHC
jgi:hypothetical protein